jgi:hypothetical protein
LWLVMVSVIIMTMLVDTLMLSQFISMSDCPFLPFSGKSIRRGK